MSEPRSLGPDHRSIGHDADVHAWARHQEAHLSAGQFAAIDLPRLADEIAALGKSEYKALRSALLRLLQHLLKWDHQPERRGQSCALTIRTQRLHVCRGLAENPSLRARRMDMLSFAYALGRDAMLQETKLSEHDVPDICPYSWDEMMTRPIVWPEP